MSLKIVDLKQQDAHVLAKIYAKTFCSINQLWKLLGATQKDAYNYIIQELKDCINKNLAFGTEIEGKIVGGITFVDMVEYAQVDGLKKQEQINFLSKLKKYANKLQAKIKAKKYIAGEHAYCTNVFIDPTFSNKGFAGKIMLYGFKMILQKGYKHSIGRASNPATTSASLHFGFIIVDYILIPQLGTKFTFMQLDLNNPKLAKMIESCEKIQKRSKQKRPSL